MYSYLPNCFGSLPLDYEVNYYSMSIFFAIEISMVLAFYLSWNKNKRYRFRKYLFEDNYWVLMICYNMSYQSIFEIYVLYFININN